MVQSQETAETRPRSNFPESRIGFSRDNQLSLIPTKRFYGSDTEYFGATAQQRDHIPLNTVWKSHNHTLSQHWYDYPQTRIIFLRLTQAKYHQITRKNSACWQINTSWLFSYTRLIQVPGCTVTRLADQHRPCFHTRKKKVLARVKVHLQFCSRLIHLTPKSLFPRPKT